MLKYQGTEGLKERFTAMAKKAIFLFSLLFIFFSTHSYALPLSTNGRWIVDATSGQRVKLACVNWATHLQLMLAEGLDKMPLEVIAAKISQHNFNCVRLTWATFMFTRGDFGGRSVQDLFDSFGLGEAREGIARNNPALLNMTVIQAYDAVVDELGAQGLMVVLDNHVSQPKWCCGNDDGNGFFGDTYFTPDEWLQGLGIVASRFKGKKQVVAVSTRNEPRGPHQNEPDWYKFILAGAARIHEANPDVLAVVSGLGYGTDLSFLKERPVEINLDNKLVFEEHWYSFSAGYLKKWEGQPSNRVCAETTNWVIEKTGFVISGEHPIPLFLGEFGIDQTAFTYPESRFLACLMAFAAETDLDWGLWAFQGSYYLREDHEGLEETFGLLDVNWDQLRNPIFTEKLRFMQGMVQDPSSKLPPSYIMYHPESGKPVDVNGNNQLYVSNSTGNRSRWNHDRDGAPIRLMDSNLCLNAVGDGLPPTLSTECLSQQSSWESVSVSKLQLAAKDQNGNYLCLEKSSDSSNSSQILTRRCICIEDDSDCLYNPLSQWFKLILTNI